MTETAIQLSTFDWAVMAGIGGTLLAALAYLIATVIKLFQASIYNETKEREKGDSNLAQLISETAKQLRELSESNGREHRDFALRDRVSESHEKLHRDVNEIKEAVARIEGGMVTQEQCLSRCAS